MADKNKRGFLERVFRRPSQDTATTKPIENKINAVNTTSTKSIQSIDTLATNEKILMQIYDEMDQDAVISAALDLFADNATLVNKKTGHVAAITSSDAAFQDEINDFLWNIFRIDSEAWHIVRNFIKYGKVFLDTKAVDDGREWSFAIADNPYNIHALVNQANEVKYFAVSPEQEEERNSTSLVFRPPNTTHNYELVPANRYLMGLNSPLANGEADPLGTTTRFFVADVKVDTVSLNYIANLMPYRFPLERTGILDETTNEIKDKDGNILDSNQSYIKFDSSKHGM
jgi:hypothetical protein